MNGGLEDIDLQSDDFIARVNSDLIGKLVNIASRSASFMHKYFDGNLAATCKDLALYQTWCNDADVIFKAYRDRDNAKAIRLIMAIADKINQYVDTHKPWVMAKDPELLPGVQDVCSMALNGFRLLMILLQPIIPDLAEKAQEFLKESSWSWQDLSPLCGHQIGVYVPLLTRLQPEQWQQMIATGAEFNS